jgi:hypothetical protein
MRLTAEQDAPRAVLLLGVRLDRHEPSSRLRDHRDHVRARGRCRLAPDRRSPRPRLPDLQRDAEAPGSIGPQPRPQRPGAAETRARAARAADKHPPMPQSGGPGAARDAAVEAYRRSGRDLDIPSGSGQRPVGRKSDEDP